MLGRGDVQVNMPSKETGASPLIFACKNGRTKVVELLLRHRDIDVNASATDNSPGLTIVYLQKQKETLESVLRASDLDGRMSMTVKHGATPLVSAAQNGHKDVVRLLLRRRDVDANLSTRGGITPLLVAILNGRREVFDMLLSHGGVDLGRADTAGVTPLMLAGKLGRVDWVDSLIREGVAVPV